MVHISMGVQYSQLDTVTLRSYLCQAQQKIINYKMATSFMVFQAFLHTDFIVIPNLEAKPQHANL